MLRLFGFLLKLAILSVIILVMGNYLEWGGKTISDQVKIQMAHPTEVGFIHDLRGWAEKLTGDAKKGFQKKVAADNSRDEEIPPSERQKLKALIRELNTSHH